MPQGKKYLKSKTENKLSKVNVFLNIDNENPKSNWFYFLGDSLPLHCHKSKFPQTERE